MGHFEKTVVIVAGTGAATARRFVHEGATVVLNGRCEENLRETIAGTDADKFLVHPGDVSDAGGPLPA